MGNLSKFYKTPSIDIEANKEKPKHEVLKEIIKAVRKKKKGRPLSTLTYDELQLLNKYNMTDKQKKYAETYIMTRDAKTACDEAGYYYPNNRPQATHLKLMQHKGIRYMIEQSEAKLRDKFEQESHEAFGLLVKFMKTDDDPRITPKLRADIAKDLLDRAGYKAVDQIKVESHVEIESRTLKEIASRARLMLVEAASGKYPELSEPAIDAECVNIMVDEKLKENLTDEN
jgi:phage terminase small subunit